MMGLSTENVKSLKYIFMNHRQVNFSKQDELLKLLEGCSAKELMRMSYTINRALLMQRQIEYPDMHGVPGSVPFSPTVDEDEIDSALGPVPSATHAPRVPSATHAAPKPEGTGKGKGVHFSGTKWVGKKGEGKKRVPAAEFESYLAKGWKAAGPRSKF